MVKGEWTSPERVERKSVWGCLRAVGFRFETGRSGDARMKVHLHTQSISGSLF